jgi:hypothetical protein
VRIQQAFFIRIPVSSYGADGAGEGVAGAPPGVSAGGVDGAGVSAGGVDGVGASAGV